jgi:hypothetical protein
MNLTRTDTITAGVRSYIVRHCIPGADKLQLRLQTLHHDAPQLGMLRIWHQVWMHERFFGL